jgi:transposase
MARERKSARMQDQIKTLRQQGHSIRKVSLALKVSRQTVRKFEAGEAGDQPESKASDEHRLWDSAIDWKAAGDALRAGTTIKQLHSELAPDDISYTRFRRRMHTKVSLPPAIAVRLQHEPGQRVQIDYCDGIPIVDRKTGEARKTQFFCGALPFSSYTFGEFVWDQKLPTFIESHERMWAFFGGVTPYAVVDNLKSGVSKAHRYDPDVNPTYCDYGNHQGFAVLPARPYTPRDKACVEATIGAIQRSFFQEVRAQTFYSLEALNEAFRAFLLRFNEQEMKDYGQSRKERFVAEKKLLLPLPAERFELFEWRSCKVHPDCHLQVQKNLYSVPYRFVGKTVRVRVSRKLVEAFFEGEPIATHPRGSGKNHAVTCEQHYPEAKRGLHSFHVQAAESEASRIGPETETLVRKLTEGSHPLRYLRRIQGILRLYQRKGVSRETAEYASKMALSFRRLRFAYIQGCVEHHQANGNGLAVVAPPREPSEMFLHGAASEPAGVEL